MHPMDRLFRIVFPAAALAIGATVLAVGWFTQPDLFERGFAPEQPIPFSHKLHAGYNRIPCQYCHTGASRSRHAGIPPLQTCMNCHAVTKTDSPSIRRLASLHRDGNAVRWDRVYSLPDHVYFDHRPHVNGGILCQSCHGPVQEMERLTRTMSLRMGSCLKCHRDPRAALPAGSAIKAGPEHCYGCHR